MRTLTLALLLLLGLGAAVEAAEEPKAKTDAPAVCPICHQIRQPNPDYGAKAGSTLARGATNLMFGWTEVIRQPALEAREGRTVRTVVVGVADGLGKGISRTAAGLGELLTFWTPKVNNRYVYTATDCPICMGRTTAEPAKHSP